MTNTGPPLSDLRLQAKFRDCPNRAGAANPREVVDQALDIIRSLEDVGDAAELFRLFCRLQENRWI